MTFGALQGPEATTQRTQTMKLHFTKMQGLGNDFVVLDGVRQRIDLSPAQLRFLADRKFGIGCDQILLVEAAPRADVDFRYRIFNADGGEVEQCGNGARCFARFVVEQGLTDKREIRVETQRGTIVPRLEDDGRVCVDMGVPEFAPERIPFRGDAGRIVQTLDVDGEAVEITAVSMGNPHAVLRVDDINAAPVHELGPKIEHHPRFPARVNVGFLHVIDRHRAQLRVWERGAGETQACGTGACAAAVAAILQGWMHTPVTLDLPGGRLTIEWEGPGHSVIMTGPAMRVYEGQVRL